MQHGFHVEVALYLEFSINCYRVNGLIDASYSAPTVIMYLYVPTYLAVHCAVCCTAVTFTVILYREILGDVLTRRARKATAILSETM